MTPRSRARLSSKPESSARLLKRVARNYPDWPSVPAFLLKIRKLKPRLVILFGSLAKEDFTDSSDADVLVCFDEPRPWMDVYQCSDGVVQPLVLSVAQLKKELREGNSLLREAVQTGLLLFGSRSLWDTMCRGSRR